MMTMNFEILAFDDHTDGQAYLADIEYSFGIQGAFKKGYKMLSEHDHVCITYADTFTTDAPMTFTDTAPHSLILEAGDSYEL